MRYLALSAVVLAALTQPALADRDRHGHHDRGDRHSSHHDRGSRYHRGHDSNHEHDEPQQCEAPANPGNPDTPTTPSSDRLPILVVGASYGNGNVPFQTGLESPLLGLAVNGGNYLSLGDALIRSSLHNGYVINEAQASSTTFTRESCRTALYGGACSGAEFDGYDVQIQRAASRTYSLSTGEFNADYVVITAPNDCLHSDAFGIPEAETVACDIEDMYDVAGRMIEAGMMAYALGMTPIYAPYPPVEALDLDLFQTSSLLQWVISPEDYQLLNDTVMGEIANELPEALVVDYWANFTHLGDGIHPDVQTSERAARTLMQAIQQHEVNPAL